MYESYLNALLRGDAIDQLRVKGWLEHMGWSAHQHFHVVAIPAGNNELLARLEGSLKRCIIEHEDSIVLVINPFDRSAYLTGIQALRDALAQCGYQAGVSSQFENIEDIQTYYRQAKEALRIGGSLEDRSIHSYPELVVYDMLLTADFKVSISNFYSRELDKLIEYDKQFGANYYDTFYTFLKSFGSKTMSAGELVIHRNTMVYRLGKIVEILDINLSDGDQYFRYYLSYKIKDLLREKEPER